MMHGLVLIVGPDRAGKTVLLDEVECQLGATLARAHSWPGLIGNRSSDDAQVLGPHVQQPRGTLPSLARLAVVFADSILGSLLWWRPKAHAQLLVVERGWYDLAVNPHRYRFPHSFTELIVNLGWLVPKADLTVLLTGDPAQLHLRKPEIGESEIVRQLAAWERLACRSGRRVLRLNTFDQPVELCATKLLEALRAAARPWYRVPAAPRRLDLRATGASPALGIYRPHAPRARRLVAVNAPLLRTRCAPRASAPPIPHLPALLKRIEAPVEDLAAFRSSAPDRWIIGAADRRRLHTVLKVGPEDRGLTTECGALEALYAAPGVALPHLAWTDQTDGWYTIATDALPTGDGEPPLEVVAGLCTRLVRGDLGRPIIHGDLAPWNLAVADDGIALWDFEEVKLNVTAPLFDLTHYVVRAGILLGRFDPAQVAALLTAAGSPGAEHLADLDVSRKEAPALVRAYLEATSPSTKEEARFRTRLDAALPS